MVALNQAGSVERRLDEVASLLATVRDVVDERPASERPPPSIDRRGWTDFLGSLSEGEVRVAEEHGLAAIITPRAGDAPASLTELASRIREACEVPNLVETAQLALRTARRGENPRKRAQVEAFVHAASVVSRNARRVVDVGAGHGHLTRELAERLALPAVGLERDGRLVERANAMPSSSPPRFETTDVLRDGFAFREGDCAVALHACGELGDALVVAAAECSASVAFVGCCLQKRRAEVRMPLRAEHRERTALQLPKSILGLSNLMSRAEGVEASLDENLAAREKRLTVRLLLASRGVEVKPSAELEGLNRRTALEDLPRLVHRVFELRGLTVPSMSEIAEMAVQARRVQAAVRRWSLPREMLARLLEIYVLFDRASHLASHGYALAYGTLFPAEASARNLAILATRTA
ncbi:hypothetical protein AKJ09_05493 [Labilithrix luteola]|uniref:Methyltransferase domain-containing protein n=1 Tax=Labilithrix luteola TaxID=1391654 RepID=A0A0K1Q0A4_9BACT|nr:methyltransferase [Labilithrix luteola]AKU98829.1 hypothetical protein AKJ09_05493 [Labilithrix luteola]